MIRIWDNFVKQKLEKTQTNSKLHMNMNIRTPKSTNIKVQDKLNDLN